MSAMPNSPALTSLSPAEAHRVASDAGRRWSSTPLRDRLRAISRLRAQLVEQADEVAKASPRPAAEFLASELIPLVEACRFLERRAERLLRPKRIGRRGRPAWLRGVRSEIIRQPLGAVLVIAPSNYPLFLPGVATLQALAAGNAVVLKPGQGGKWAADALAANLPDAVVQVLDDSPETGHLALGCGFDKVLFTGSAATGRKVLTEAARSLTPATLELSGCDLVLVLPGADLDRAAKAIAFGLALNGGCTCIAPRRLLVPRSMEADLITALRFALETRPHAVLDAVTARKLKRLVGDGQPAIGGFGANGIFKPAVFTDLPNDHPLASADIFAPVALIQAYNDLDTAIDLANRCPYKLGASVFGALGAARAAARQLQVCNVSLNDLIVPTADPRLPFPARGESGFGVTRGAEGLLALTRPKVIASRGGKWLPHLDPPSPGDADLLTGYLQLTHGAKLRDRLAGLGRLKHALKNRNTKKTNRLES